MQEKRRLLCKKNSIRYIHFADLLTFRLKRRTAMFGQMDLVLIGGVALLFFGSGKIPELMKGLGKGLSEFKKAQHALENDINNVVDAPEKKKH